MDEEYCLQIESVVQQIIKTLNPGKVYCYAVIKCIEECWSTLITKRIGDQHFHSHLLVMSHLSDKEKIQRLLNKITVDETLGIAVSILALPMKQVKHYVRRRDEFINSVLTHGHLLYSDNTLTIHPCVPPTRKQQKKRIRQCHTHLAEANRFYNAAVQAITDDDYPMAMLQLHQAVKKACTAVTNGYFCFSMKCEKLKDQWIFIQAVVPWLSKAFPKNTAEEDELFQDLCAAPQHIHKPNYIIAPHKVNAISARVSDLLKAIKDHLNEIS